jgi:hypothetical protein
MNQLQIQIQNYLQKNFGKKTFVYDKSIPDDETSDLWGFHSIKILIIDNGNVVRYRTMASK